MIGLQIVETTLEDEVARCEKDVRQSFNAVLVGIRGGDIVASKEQVGDISHSIASLLQSTGVSDHTPELLRLELEQELFELHQCLRNDMEKYRREFGAAASAPDAAGSLDSAFCKCGGWADVDDERFLKVQRGFNERQGSNKSKKMELLYDEMAAVLPHIALKEIKCHAKFHQHLRFYQEKCRDRNREFKRHVGEFQARAAERVQQAERQQAERERKEQELSAQKQKCGDLRGKVDKWRVTKEAKKRIEQQQREVEALVQRQQREEEELKWKKKQDQQKVAIDEYRQVCSLLPGDGLKLTGVAGQERADHGADCPRAAGNRGADGDGEAEGGAIARQQRARAVPAGRVPGLPRLSFVVVSVYADDERFAEQRKLEELRREEEERVHAEEQRIAKLNALKEQTPYAQIVASIVVSVALVLYPVVYASDPTLCLLFAMQPDPERTRQETAAFRANVEAAQDDLPVHVSLANAS